MEPPEELQDRRAEECLKVFVLLLAVTHLFAAEWDAVQRIPAGRTVEVTSLDGARATGTFVSATQDAVTVRQTSGDRSITRAEIRKLRVKDSSHRIRNGLIWTAVGAAVG